MVSEKDRASVLDAELAKLKERYAFYLSDLSMITYIGRMQSRPLRISFVADVLNKVTIGGGYPEYLELEKDLRKT